MHAGGLDLASLLIKEAVLHLRQQFPRISTFCTLSPIPGFMRWLASIKVSISSLHSSNSLAVPIPGTYMNSLKVLAGVSDNVLVLKWLLNTIKESNWIEDASLVKNLKIPVRWHYMCICL